MIYAAIAAGGVGCRMGADLPKQFLDLCGEPIIVRTVKAFKEKADKVYIGVVSGWEEYTAELLKKHNLEDYAFVVTGGENRMETLYNIICKIEAESSVNEEDILLTHDAVRPFINNRIINENIEKCRKYGACGTFVPAVDTMAISDDGTLIKSVPSRETLYNCQTPQTAKLSLISSLLKKNKNCFSSFTDLCGMLSSFNIPVAMVTGEYSNIKITNPSDMKMSEVFVGE